MQLSSILTALPAHLRERVHVTGPPSEPAHSPSDPARDLPIATGGFILYWMRTAVRGHENPALDAALACSALLGRPLLVYHALSERYPYASDRHHQFILEGARDVAAELAARGIGYAFHLERPGQRGPHLRTLAEQACLVITEDMPWAPLLAWTASLAGSLRRPILCVDTACILPARRIGRAWLRAFAFRTATSEERRTRAVQIWPEITPAFPAYVPRLPFTPVDLAGADLPALIAECEIDHSLPAVPHTRGGRRAGYDRFARFLRDGLPGYGDQRDNPLAPAGASRMSAYLHYGHVSPLRLARDLLSTPPSESREKFLDEFLTWRELAHVYCTYEPGHETLAAVPEWAKKTLREHQIDRRPILPSWERLARGQTGVPLWDAAQTSLLVHGELHNNLRMTWGKAVLAWTPDAATALALLIDLNHRYALDGRDPSSYGGILWCFGQFDRPFPPNRPHLGIIRPRSLRVQEGKLDLPALQRKVTTPAHTWPPRVAVLGDSPAARLCARTLADQRFPVCLLLPPPRESKPGADRQEMQPFCISDRRLRRYVESWMQDGCISCTDAGDDTSPPRYVGKGPVSSLLDHLGHGLIQHPLRPQATLARTPQGFVLRGIQAADLFASTSEPAPFDTLLAVDAAGQAWLHEALQPLGLSPPTAPTGTNAHYDRRSRLGLSLTPPPDLPQALHLQHSLLAAHSLCGHLFAATE
jgi:photolyase PhrII